MIRKLSLPILVWTLALLVSAPLAAQQQFARPDGTIGSTANYTVTGAPTHWEAVDEVSANDGDFVQSTANPGVIEFSLTDTVIAPAVDSGHIIKFRAENSGGKKAITITISLYEGGGLVGENTFNIPKGSNWTEYTYTIPTAVITTYNNLSIRLSATGNTNSPALISWVELETPPPGVVADPPTLAVTPTSADITENSATLGGNVTLDGGATVTSRGVEWGATPSGPYPNSQSAAAGGTGIFTVPVTGLNPGTDYYFRAWAINSGGTGNSSEGTFTTNTPASAPTVIDPTVDGPSVTNSSALLGGNVTADGGASVTDRGIVWNTTSPAESGGTIISEGSGLGVFTRLVSSLPAGILIYFRAYATNTAGTSYSIENSFTTLAGLATVTVDPASSITSTSAFFSGEVTSDGGATVTDRGTAWGTAPNPTGNILSAGSGLGTFGHTRTGLPTGTLVYFRTYATNSAGTAYSADQSFTPSEPPVLGPPSDANVTYFSATLGGIITSDGGNPIISRGTVWNTTGTPVVENPLAEGGTTINEAFSHTRFLPAGTTIYYRAYASSAIGTGYSTQGSFITGTEPTVQASNISFPRVAARSMKISWTPGNGEGSMVVLRLQTTTKTDPLDGNDYTADPEFGLGTEFSQNFVVYKGSSSAMIVTGLTADTTYSVAIYDYAGIDAGTDYLLGPVEASQLTTNVPVHNLDNNIQCNECHNHGGFDYVPTNTDQEVVCKTCHNDTGVAKNKLEFALHLTPNKNPALDYVDCGYCHELHNPTGENTITSFNSITSLTDNNKSFLRANVDKYVPTATSDDAFLHNDTYDAADPANAITPERAVEGGDDTTARGFCQVCHSLTNYHRSSNTAGADQCHNGETGNCGPAETHCATCHQHNNKFIGVGGTQTCIECHSSAQGPRPIITSQFARNSTHIPSGDTTATQEDCLVCHDQGGHQAGKISGWDADDGVTSFTQLTAYAATTVTGEGEQFEGHCMSCHDDGSASNLPASGADQTQTSPFIGSAAPPVIGLSNWSTAGHNRPVATSGSSPVTCVGDGANGCHASGHGSDQNFLLAPATGAAISPTDFCFVCHDSDGPSSLNIQAQFNTATNYQANGAGGALLNQRHDISSADQTYSGGAVTCKDCHSPHVDNTGNPVQDPDTGAALASYSPANTYTDDGNSLDYDAGGNLDPTNAEGMAGGLTEPDYIQFCLTCHDGTTPPGVTMSANMIHMADAYGGDQHGLGEGSSGSRTGKGNLKPPYTTSADFAAGDDPTNPYAAMNCNTCHGAHGSDNIFNLRTSITVSGVVMNVGGQSGSEFETFSGSTYTLPVNGGSQNKQEYGAWCTFCHEMNSHAGVDETTTCQSGHQHGNSAF